jgi:glyoxylase-like metal-dependent hydrolase (beta-lactamase superfamily II)
MEHRWRKSVERRTRHGAALGTRATTTLLLVGLLSRSAFCGDVAQEQRSPEAMAAYASAVSHAEVIHVQANIYMINAGAGSNVVVQLGPDGVLVVDAAVASVSNQILDAIHALTDKPIRYLLDTSADPEHVGGNQQISRAGSTYGGGHTKDSQYSFIYAHENVLAALSAPTGKKAVMPSEAWPTDTYFEDSLEVHFNGEPVELLYQPNAHSDADSIVFFRGSDVIVAGDIYMTTSYPRIDLKHGGSIDGVIAALNRIIDLTIPLRNQEDGTLVVPGHGRVSDEYDVVVYRDMVTVIRDRVKDLIGKGMTLQAIQASRPSSDYDGRYGAASGPWTTVQFIEAVYESLRSPPTAPAAN